MGQVYGLLGHDDRARAVSEQATRLISPHTPINEAYFIEANLAERRYDFSAAEQKYLELIRLYPNDPVWHYHLARVYGQQGLYAKGLNSYQEALSRDSKYIVAYQHLGTLYSRTRDYDQALSHTQKALNLYRALRNREGEARALLDLANVFRFQGNIQEAKETAQSALQIFTELRNQFGILEAKARLGNVYYSEGKFKQARGYYEQVLAADSEPRNNRLVALGLMNVGVTYAREGNLAKAIEYYERSLAQQRAYGEYKDWPALRERTLALNNLAVIHIEYGPDPGRGAQLAREALAIHQMMGDKRWEARAHNSLGLYHMNSGRYRRAIDRFQQAQTLARSVGEGVQDLGFSTYNLGRCYFFQNQYEQGLESVSKALAVFRDLEDPFYLALSQILLGWIYHRLGDSDQARPLLEEGLQTSITKGYGELLPDAYAALGELYLESGERDRATQSWQRGSALWKEPAVSESSIEARSNLGLLVAEEGNLDRGLSYSQASVVRARRLKHRHTLARTLINLAGVHLLRNEYAEAGQVLEELTLLGEQELGLELRAQAFHVTGKALQGLGKTGEAEASYRQGQEAIRKLQFGLDASHRESFAARREIKVLFP